MSDSSTSALRVHRAGNLFRMHVQNFNVGDLVETPRGLKARVVDWQAGRCDLAYEQSDLGGVILDPAHLRLLHRADD